MRALKLLVLVMVVVASFASTGSASASANCARYVTVQWGDTLSGLAAQNSTTMDAIRSANPGLGWWVYAGQSLCILASSSPVSYPTYNTYTIQWGDTLGKIATRSGTSLSSLIAANPQIANPSLIYPGQVINLPAGVSVPSQPATPETPSTPSDAYARLTITYTHGLFIRADPGGKILASALYKDVLLYRKNSVYTDANNKVWVEVRLFKPTKGYYVGWILVQDQLDSYFTEPNISN